jgi:SNF2 family DNA or RNA helicase
MYKMPLLAAECLLGEPTVKLSADLQKAIKKVATRPQPLRTDESFPWTLYPFQARDAARALRIIETAGGVLLAGDMGSGKTTVALAVAHTMELWPLLIVAPLAAFSTWSRQLAELGRKVVFTTGPMAETWEVLNSRDYDAVVVSYDRLHALVELLEQLNFKAIIADEIQRIRTPGSRRSRALRALSGSVPYRIGLSGTPLQNRATDLLPLGAFLVPGEWRPRGAGDLSDIYPSEDPVNSLATHLGSLMVRRKMEDTGVSLPGKNVHRLHVTLTPEQHRALEELRLEATEERDTTGYGPSDRMHVFTRLQKMRQIISCPQMANVGGPNPKVRGAIDLAEEYIDSGRKGIIFCVYRQTWREIGQALDAAGIAWRGIWGSSSLNERLEAEASFHADPNTKVFIGTLAACSEALTLSPTATFCLFTDLSYSPSDLAQAEARAYRMNTIEPVDVVYLHASAPGGTVDDRMVELLAIKQELFAKVIDGEHSWADPAKVHYSLDDLVYLVTGEHDLGQGGGSGKRRKKVKEKEIVKLDFDLADLVDG